MKNLEINRIREPKVAYRILCEFDNVYEPPLHLRIVDLALYAKKLVSKGYVYVILKDAKPQGFVTFYSNDSVSKTGYLSQLAIKPDCLVKGAGYNLLKLFEKVSCENGMEKLKLEVYDSNVHAINFYKKNGYKVVEKASDKSSYMMKRIK